MEPETKEIVKPKNTRTQKKDSIADSIVPKEFISDEPVSRERMRGCIALLLVGILIVQIIFAFLAVVMKWLTIDEIKELFSLIFSPTIGLVGAATGFYFGSKR